MIYTPSDELPPLPAVSFAEADFCGKIDAKRFRAGERNTRRARSPIAGFGSFAVRRIPRGEPILVREPLTGNYPINHSLTPNAARAASRYGLFALREIEAGEEITEDYRFLPYFKQAIPVLPQTLTIASPTEYDSLIAKHLGQKIVDQKLRLGKGLR